MNNITQRNQSALTSTLCHSIKPNNCLWTSSIISHGGDGGLCRLPVSAVHRKWILVFMDRVLAPL